MRNLILRHLCATFRIFSIDRVRRRLSLVHHSNLDVEIFCRRFCGCKQASKTANSWVTNYVMLIMVTSRILVCSDSSEGSSEAKICQKCAERHTQLESSVAGDLMLLLLDQTS